MAKRHIKSCSSSLIIKEMQIKTMRYHLTAIRMTFIKKITNKKCWRRCVGKRTFIHCWWEYKLVWPLWRTLWKFPKKIKIELYYMMCIPTPGHIFRGKKNDLKGYVHFNIHCSASYNTQGLKAT